MVLEALAAVGLAGNIVQFVDFSCRLLSTATTIHRAGAAQNVQDVDTVTQALRQWCEKISSARTMTAQQRVLEDHQSLLELAEKCQIAATHLLSATQALKAKHPGSKWSSFKSALATAWNENEITDMADRLESYRHQMGLEVALLQSKDHQRMWESLDKLDTSNQQLGESTLLQISRAKAEISFALTALRRDMIEIRSDTTRQAISSTPSPIKMAELDHNTYAALTDMLSNCQSKASDMVVALTILHTLTFDHMHYREAMVLDAHPGTFEWVFKDQFSAWLRSSDPIFWISGKPGSGKSTLMKYLINHPQTPVNLNSWSSPHGLVMADYFFWINGTELQRSLEGLLRGLLYDVLRQTPSLVKDLLPDAWISASEHLAIWTSNKPWKSPEWTRELLLQAFKRMSFVKNMTTKFCIFVDGLDEYNGDHEDLILVIRHLTQVGIKLCAASRPWNIFEGAFGAEKTQKLYLQELNKPDIECYVNETLRAHPNFKKVEPTHANDIAVEVIDKSQGVFLWVRLAVTSLLEGLRNLDSASILRKRLREFPSDLNEFFQHMFISLQSVYRPHLSHMFQIALIVIEPLSPVAFWCLDELDNHPDTVLNLPIRAVEAPETALIVEDMTIRINGRSKGLLEVTRHSLHEFAPEMHPEAYSEARVDFLHRTVKDFIRTTEVHTMLIEWQHSHFDPDMALCNMMLANFKIVAFTPRVLEGPSTLKKLLMQFFTSAARIEQSSRKPIIAQIDELERIAAEYSRLQPLARYGLWELLGCSSLLSVALLYDMRNLFVEKMKWDTIPAREKAKTAKLVLLNNRLWKSSGTNDTELDGLSDQMRSLLLSNPPPETHEEFEDALFNRLSDVIRLDPAMLVSVVKAFARRSIISSLTIEDWVWKKRLADRLGENGYEELHACVVDIGLSNQTSFGSISSLDASTAGATASPASQISTPTIVVQEETDTQYGQHLASTAPNTTTQPKARPRSIREGMKRLSRRFRE